jgi:hypothetical protein
MKVCKILVKSSLWMQIKRAMLKIPIVNLIQINFKMFKCKMEEMKKNRIKIHVLSLLMNFNLIYLKFKSMTTKMVKI